MDKCQKINIVVTIFHLRKTPAMQVWWAHRRRCARILLRQVIILISDKISYVECTDGHCQNLKKITTISVQGYAT